MKSSSAIGRELGYHFSGLPALVPEGVVDESIALQAIIRCVERPRDEGFECLVPRTRMKVLNNASVCPSGRQQRLMTGIERLYT